MRAAHAKAPSYRGACSNRERTGNGSHRQPHHRQHHDRRQRRAAPSRRRPRRHHHRDGDRRRAREGIPDRHRRCPRILYRSATQPGKPPGQICWNNAVRGPPILLPVSQYPSGDGATQTPLMKPDERLRRDAILRRSPPRHTSPRPRATAPASARRTPARDDVRLRGRSEVMRPSQ